LADWLQVSPDELRFGHPLAGVQEGVSDPLYASLSLVDREMLIRYFSLAIAERKIVRDVVEALCVAATVKKVK
jgi:hypothetical protein